jgi:uncharacterized RDD family membrane protein YckC
MVEGQITYSTNNFIILTSNDGLNVIKYRYAGFGERAAARLIDVIIIILPCLIPIAGPIISWLYFSLFIGGKKQQTIGQRIMNIKVLSENGSKISFLHATGRWLSNAICTIFTLGISILFMLWSKKRQCLHDNIANTIVVYELKNQDF